MIELKNIKKYEMIATRIEQMMLDSGMKTGDRLSSVNDLCQLFNVAPATICNSLELLRDRNVIVSISRKGNFVEKLPTPKQELGSDFAEYLEHCNSTGSLSLTRRKTLSIYMDEYGFSFRKHLWDKIFKAFCRECGNVEIKVIDDIDKIESADIILHDNSHLPTQAVMNSCDLRQKLYKGLDLSDYFPVVWNSLSGNQLASMPFAISQALRFFNCDLLEQHCPKFLDNDLENLITAIMAKCEYKSSKFPAIAMFIHFLPLTLIEEGVAAYDIKTGEFDFSDHRIPEFLKFNRCMVDKLQNKHENWAELSTGSVWNKFMKGELLALDTFSYALPAIKNSDFKIMAKPSPAASRLKCSVTSIQMLGMGCNCRNASVALEFIRFACGPKGQIILAESKCNIPVLRACAGSDVFLNACPENMNESFKELYFENSLYRSLIFNDVSFNKIHNITADYYSGKINLAETVKQLKTIKK